MRCRALKLIEKTNTSARNEFAEDVARRNVVHTVRNILDKSQTIGKLVDEGRLAIVGAVYDVASGKVEFLIKDAVGLPEHGS